jgi:hypothetical protein
MIKRSFTALAVMFISLSAHSADVSKDGLEECARVENSAKAVMKARQGGLPISELHKMAEEAGKQNEYVGGLYKTLIEQAYAIPQYSDEATREKTIFEFHKNFYGACVVVLERAAKKG